MKTNVPFQKKKEYLICFDSDGCVMDTMNVKHNACFGPCMIAQWNLQAWQAPILARWNDINLYTMTRGINRFKGLAIALAEIDAAYTPIGGLATFLQWAQDAAELSNDALALAATANSVCMTKALAWSRSVNAAIAALHEDEKTAFPLAAHGLHAAHQMADVAVVSSANKDAVQEEWQKHDLLQDVDILMTQEEGSKAACIALLAKAGYAKDHILMVGDAPGDLNAAEKNNVLFYPILVRHERDSWHEFAEKALPAFLKQNSSAYWQQKQAAFLQNLAP